MQLIAIILLSFILSENLTPIHKFLYFSDYEKGGGGPWSFDNGNPSLETRRGIFWGSGDFLNSGWNGNSLCQCSFLSNHGITTSSFGTPTFDITLSVVEDDNGNVNYPNIQAGTVNQIFQGEPAIDTVSAIIYSGPDYNILNQYADNIFDATEKLNFNSATGARDTLIMTDIEFFTSDGQDGFKVKQWWFLKPPYFKSDFSSAQPYMFSFLIDNFSSDCGQINGELDIRTCPNYIQQLENFHSKTIIPFTGQDSFIPPDNWGIVSGNHGFQHYDFPAVYEPGNWISQFEIDNEQPFNTPDQLLPEYSEEGGSKTFICTEPTAIYVNGGPVRVHGRYKGQYTIFTDEYTTYHRHAWASDMNQASPIDTLWNNIWITDDIINNDAEMDNGRWSLFSAQPDTECNNGSLNSMGLVSGANVIVANTTANGARDCWSDDFCDVNIHAHITALNESFTVQYSNNTYASAGANPWSNPPFGDGQGIDKFGQSGNDDTRGKIVLWGGLAQKFRGYTRRNNPGPYYLPSGNIGYDYKEYNYDCNLICNPPPFYPGFGPGCTDINSSNFNPLSTIDNGSCLYYTAGDLTQDGFINVTDIVYMLNIILYGATDGYTPTELELGDIAPYGNLDGIINVIDVVALVNIILEQ